MRSEIVDMTRAEGFVAASRDNDIDGLIAYRYKGDDCEILSLDSVHQGKGVVTALLAQVVALAKSHGCRRVTLITTNDNLQAHGFY